MIQHAIFPTLIGQWHYNDSVKFKKTIQKTAIKYLDKHGFSNESTGHVTIHHEPKFKNFYTFVSDSLKEYIQTLNVDPERFDLNLVKSWFNIIKDTNTPHHNHGDAHVSFVYYINLPTNIQKNLHFCRTHPIHNDLFYGMLKYNNNGQWNSFNALGYNFAVEEGQLYIFPGSLFHENTDVNTSAQYENAGVKSKEDLYTRRVSIAGDFILTFKESMALPLGLQPIKNWKVFS